MATYYVSNFGSDANNGLGPDPAAATNKPWLTLGKALGAAGIGSGDTLWICPGVYREAITVNMTSATAETKITGDVENQSGFKDGGGALVSGGEIIWSGWTTNDLSAGSSSSCLNLNGRDFLTIQKITFIPYTGKAIFAQAAVSINITIQDCAFIFYGTQTAAIEFNDAADTAMNWIIERCIFAGVQNAFRITLPTSSVADYDANIVIRNCMLSGHGGNPPISVLSSGALAFKGGGVTVMNCTMFSADKGVQTGSANLSTTFPVKVYYCWFWCRTGCTDANVSGQIVEDYNVLNCQGTIRTNVTAGTNSLSGNPAAFAPRISVGQEWLLGFQPKPFGTPQVGGPFLGWVPTGLSPAPQTVDLLNRPRPAGGASLNTSVGVLERHDTGAKEVTTVDAGGIGLVIAGPGDQDIRIPVDAVSTTLTIRARYDSTHAATTKPQVILLANGEIGVATQTVTMTAAADTWETLTLSAFTPTAKGVVVLRMVSRPAAGGGKAFFDTLG